MPLAAIRAAHNAVNKSGTLPKKMKLSNIAPDHHSVFERCDLVCLSNPVGLGQPGRNPWADMKPVATSMANSSQAGTLQARNRKSSAGFVPVGEFSRPEGQPQQATEINKKRWPCRMT